MMKKHLGELLIAVTAILAVTLSTYENHLQAATIYVPVDQSTIQAAIDAAAVIGDVVIVSPGTYLENITIDGKSITVQSESGPGVTIIDGGGNGPVVNMPNTIYGLISLKGFTITNGNGPSGGGILITSGGANPDLAIDNCIITHNTASDSGGGIAINAADYAVYLRTCLITNNTATNGFGGGIYLSGSTMYGMIQLQNTISDNTAGLGGHGIAGINGAYIHGANNIIWGNSSDGIDEIYVDEFPSYVGLESSDVMGGWAPGPTTPNFDCDPNFVGPDDYHLQSGSCCIDAGTNTVGLSEDIEGTPRPQGAGYDVGAYETCTDADSDLWTTCDGDCNDGDPFVNPGSTEVCDNGIDDDCNGMSDCDDGECIDFPTCLSSCADYQTKNDCNADCVCKWSNKDRVCNDNPDPNSCGCTVTENPEVSCSDGKDNDCDGLTDSDDPDCPPGPCNNNGICESGEDCLSCSNDCDGRTGGKPANRYCCGNGMPEDPEGDGTICDGNF